MELLLETAGESHGRSLVAILVGLPTGSPADAAYVDARLAARQRGRGNSARQRTERDAVELLAGVRNGVATGNPIALSVANRDTRYADLPPVHAPRPGHADLAGALNRGLVDVRDVIERASARETAVRVAAGALAAAFLEVLGIHVLGHVVAIGGVDVAGSPGADLEAARATRDTSDLHALGPAPAQDEARAAIDAAGRDGDTLGGIVEVVATGVPAGLGGHERPESKLSACLGAALMGIPAVRGMDIGLGFRAASLRGSAVHDPIVPSPQGPLPARQGNGAGRRASGKVWATGAEGAQSASIRIGAVRRCIEPLAGALSRRGCLVAVVRGTVSRACAEFKRPRHRFARPGPPQGCSGMRRESVST